MKRVLCLLILLALLLQSSALATEVVVPIGETDEGGLVVEATPRPPLAFGAKGEAVVQLQTRLKELQYYAGPISGDYLEATRKAVRAVQTAYGLQPSGDADSQTQDIIYGDCYRPLARGASGEMVKRLQARLSEVGYYWGKITGNYLDGTTAAVGNFQQDNGLERTGKADVKTQQKLFSDDVVMAQPKAGATALPQATPALPANTAFPGALRYGSRGDGVKTLQDRLKALGFFSKKSSGGYYTHTQAAVKEFQKYNGLVANGAVDADTWEALFAMDVVGSKGVPKPAPTPKPVPYYVEVDVANQLVKVFARNENNEFKKLERVMYCSTGTESFPSEPGSHILSGKKAASALFPTWGNATARYWVQITPEIAFHSILFKSSGALSTSSVARLGRRASHGCIRLSMGDAKWMYDNLTKGVEVFIYEDGLVDPELKYANRLGEFDHTTFYHRATPMPTAQPSYNPQQPPVLTIRELGIDSQGEDVFWLQMKLKEMGFYPGTVTGQYREGTQAAVKAYQKANGIRASGKANAMTLEHLYAKVREQYASTPAPALTPAPAPSVLPGQTPQPTVDLQGPATPTPQPSPTENFTVG